MTACDERCHAQSKEVLSSATIIPLPFHGQSPTEDVEAVFADPAVLASTGKYPMGQSPNI